MPETIPEPSKPSFATAEDILKTPDAIYTEINAPELKPGMKVRVKIPNAIQLENLESGDRSFDPINGRPLEVPGKFTRWTLACAVNADDSPMFKPEHEPMLKKKLGGLHAESIRRRRMAFQT